MNNLNVCLCSLRIQWEQKDTNLESLKSILERVHPETDLLILPETFSTGFPAGDKEHIRPLAERSTGSTIELLKQLSSQYNIAIAGSFIADVGGSLCNRAFFIEPGEEETFADKRHLFTMAGEHKSFSHGYERMKVRFRGWNISMIVCYDIRFPVWCRNVDNEYDLLIAVANWPKVRVDAWNKLLLARAIENEAYVCGVDCLGTDLGGFEYNGSSMVVDFKGKVISSYESAEANDSPDEKVASEVALSGGDSPLVYAQLNLDSLIRFRTKFPAWKDADRFTLDKNE